MTECETVIGWQPIDTAPKDGTRVLLFVEKRVEIGRFVDFATLEYGVETSRVQEWRIVREFPTIRLPGDPTATPTHWMPLPPAPLIDGCEGEQPARLPA